MRTCVVLGLNLDNTGNSRTVHYKALVLEPEGWRKEMTTIGCMHSSMPRGPHLFRCPKQYTIESTTNLKLRVLTFTTKKSSSFLIIQVRCWFTIQSFGKIEYFHVF
jgi:hypothetical protein